LHGRDTRFELRFDARAASAEAPPTPPMGLAITVPDRRESVSVVDSQLATAEPLCVHVDCSDHILGDVRDEDVSHVQILWVRTAVIV
jgi:hypothetical protein